MKQRIFLILSITLLLCLLTLFESLGYTASGPHNNSFVAFESGHVRPLAISPNGQTLCAVNTPDNRIEVFDIADNTLNHRFSIPVGLEPVAIAMPDNNEAWVVNHLSDSVSIVRIESTRAASRVIRTLLVGDEPQDIVFAGTGNSRAFITCAHRGQNAPFNPQFTTQGVGRADVWVFNRNQAANGSEQQPETIVNLFGDSPRALAATPDGATVYAAIFHSGNQTTVISNSKRNPLPKTEPNTSPAGVPAPLTSLIVSNEAGKWVDETGSDYSAHVQMTLPDYDVFAINATDNLPQVSARYSAVGTTLFNMTINPANGSIYVSNIEARNQVRFEGSGQRGTTLRGHFIENRITVIKNTGVYPRHLNKHLDYSKDKGSAEDRIPSIATPLEMTVTPDGNTLYAVAFGSQKVARYSTRELEDDSFVPAAANMLQLSAGGPSGMVMDEQRGLLYVFTRFNNGISVIDLKTFTELENIALFNPEPSSIINGRPFLYDAALTSGFGDSSCAGCHVFGDADGLAWDLGNPDAEVTDNPNEYADITFMPKPRPQFHPLKGPKVTQSLRGIADSGPMHWRGDRTGINRAPGESVESAAFKEFNATFETLHGRESRLTQEQMQSFTNFALQITYPPNPVRSLDNSLTLLQAEGRRIFHEDRTSMRLFSFGGPVTDRCVECHELDPQNRKFGTGGKMANVRGAQDGKVPHLRNMYQKVGMFDFDSVSRGMPADLPQTRGFGYNPEGTSDTIFTHFIVGRFDLRGGLMFALKAGIPVKDSKATALIEYLMAFDSNLAPIVGQQITLFSNSALETFERMELFIQRAGKFECDLVAKGSLNGESRGWVMTVAAANSDDTVFQSDRKSEQHTAAQLKQIAAQPGQELTFTCVPFGSGTRIGIDRDEDGIYDANDLS